MSTNIKHAVFLILGILALIVTWPHAFDWMRAGGNILNPIDFFRDAIAAGGTAAFLSLDMLIAWIVLINPHGIPHQPSNAVFVKELSFALSKQSGQPTINFLLC